MRDAEKRLSSYSDSSDNLFLDATLRALNDSRMVLLSSESIPFGSRDWISEVLLLDELTLIALNESMTALLSTGSIDISETLFFDGLMLMSFNELRIVLSLSSSSLLSEALITMSLMFISEAMDFLGAVVIFWFVCATDGDCCSDPHSIPSFSGDGVLGIVCMTSGGRCGGGNGAFDLVIVSITDGGCCHFPKKVFGTPCCFWTCCM